MTFIDHLKGNNPEALLLEVAVGTHVIAGDLSKSKVTGSSPTHIVTVQMLLGEAFGKGWSGPRGVWFRGVNRDSSKYQFHPGIMSPGNTDTVQGIDDVFDQDTPHSNTAWIRCECPNGSEVGIPDFDTKSNPPTGLFGIYDCQLGDIYDEDGTIIDSDVLLVNPADVLAFGLKEIRRFPDSRIDWASLDVIRTASDVAAVPDYTEILPVGVGLTGSYYDGTGFATFKSKRVDPVIEYDSSNGAPALDLTPGDFSVRFEGKIKFKYAEEYTLYLTHDDYGRLAIDDLGTWLIDETAYGTHSTTFTPDPDAWYDIKLEWEDTGSPAQFMFEWQSASQSRQVVPQDALYPKAEALPRFRTNLAFTQRTNFDAFLRAVLFTCNGGFQDANGKLRFFILDDQTASFDFTEANIVKNTFKYYPRFTQQELLQLPNRFIADGRDLESRYLEPFDPPLVYDFAALQEIAGRVIEEKVLVGNVTRVQGLDNLTAYAKKRTQPLICEFEGMPSTLAVLPGDVVTVTHPLAAWEGEDFLVIEATDKSIDRDPDQRIFKLLNWTTPFGVAFGGDALVFGPDFPTFGA